MHAEMRIEYLADEGSFQPFQPPGSSAFLAGPGKMNGMKVVFCATETRLDRQVDVLDGVKNYLQALQEAEQSGCPFILLLDSGPQNESAGKLESLFPEQLFLGPEGLGSVMYEQGRLAGKVPRLGAVLGPVAASRAFLAALCDAVAFIRGAGLAMAAPIMVKELTGETMDFWHLGGSDVHYNRTGLADALLANEEEVLDWISHAVFCFQAAALKNMRVEFEEPEQTAEINPGSSVNMKQFIRGIVDRDSIIEMQGGYRPECIAALVRVEGRVAGIVANNPIESNGLLYAETCEKIVRFIRMCDSFEIPLVFLADTPGFMLGREAEWKGGIKSGGALFGALAALKVRRISIVVRRAFSQGMYAMCGPGFGAESVSALPGASILFYNDRLLKFYLETPYIGYNERNVLHEMLNTAGDPGVLVERGRLDRVIEAEDIRAFIGDFLSRPGSVNINKTP